MAVNPRDFVYSGRMLFRRKASVAALVDAFNAQDWSALEWLLARDATFMDRDGRLVAGRDKLLVLAKAMMGSDRGFHHRLDKVTRRAGMDLATLTVFHSLAPDGERLLWQVRYAKRRIASVEAFRDGKMEGIGGLFGGERSEDDAKTPQRRAAG